MRTDKELLKDAVDAIEAVLCTECAEPWGLIEEIRARLDEPEHEPIAWMDVDGNVSDNNDCNCFPIPLYRHPPRPTGLDQLLERIRFLEQQMAEKNQ